MAYYSLLWGITVGLCVFPILLNIRWICKEYATLNKRHLHLIPATISMLFYIFSASFSFADTFFSTSIFCEVGSIYCWAIAEIGIHLFFIIHIYEEFHDDMYDDELHLKLQKKEKIILVILIGIFACCQFCVGLNAMFLHYDVYDHLTANWTDLWMTILSLISDVSVCIYLLKMFRDRLMKMDVNTGDINSVDNEAFAILTKYYLLLGAGTVITALGQSIYVIADAIHLHGRSKQFWVDDNSTIDQWTYFAWSADIIINICLIYLNIESGESVYKLCCKGKCEGCIRWSTLDAAGIALLPQTNHNIHNQN